MYHIVFGKATTLPCVKYHKFYPDINQIFNTLTNQQQIFQQLLRYSFFINSLFNWVQRALLSAISTAFPNSFAKRLHLSTNETTLICDDSNYTTIESQLALQTNASTDITWTTHPNYIDNRFTFKQRDDDSNYGDGVWHNSMNVNDYYKTESTGTETTYYTPLRN